MLVHKLKTSVKFYAIKIYYHIKNKVYQIEVNNNEFFLTYFKRIIQNHSKEKKKKAKHIITHTCFTHQNSYQKHIVKSSLKNNQHMACENAQSLH